MKIQKSKIKNQNYGVLLLIFFLLVTCHSSLVTAAQWSGVDESVVEKYAEDHGRVARAPFINTDQGDLLLFMFLAGGATAGFAAGYYWRSLTESKARNRAGEEKANDSV
jgi:hypothetical protein